MIYNKLVRDKIPEIVKEDGKTPITHIANDEEFWNKLKEKLNEETQEFFGAISEEELADVFEVLEKICMFKGMNKKEIAWERKFKAKERGVFNKRIILEEVRE